MNDAGSPGVVERRPGAGVVGQTHLPYVGVAGGLAAGTVVVAFVSTSWRWRARAGPDRQSPPPDTSNRNVESLQFRRLLRWSAASAVIGVVLWLPPVVDQLRSTTGGNLGILWHDLAHPAGPPIGIVRGIRLLLAHLNPIAFFGEHPFLVDSSTLDWGGVAAFVIWAASVVAAWRMRARSLVTADAVLAGSLVIGAVVLSRINGPELWYLMLWAWTIGIAMAATVVWTFVEVVRRVDLGERRRIVVASGHAVLGVTMAALFLASTISAVEITTPDRTQSDQLARLAPATITALRAGRLPGDSMRGRLVVTWDDPINYGGEAYGLLDALTGAGIAAGLRPVFAGVVADRMLVPAGTERGVVHVAVGEDAINTWRRNPDAVEVARADGRSADAIAERARLLREVRRLLRRDGENPRLIDHGMQAATGLDLGPEVVQRLNRLRQIGLPVTVFLAPAGA